ncbi:glycine cleavage system protein GcvH [bacterium]|nr:glycine cleavage system protein GcvH [bacterium]
MNVPADLRYTKEHEWIKIDGTELTIGITDYAQGELGDIVFVELPAVGSQTEQMKACGSIEAVKAVSDLYAPVSGTVTAVNTSLETDPQRVNRDPYGEGWMIRIAVTDQGQIDSLLTADAYQQHIDHV